MKNFRLDKNNVLILVVAILSISNILIQSGSQNYLSDANSIVGLAGVVLFFSGRSFFRYFIWAWIAAQAIIIDHNYLDTATSNVIEEPIFDLSQLFSYKLGFSVSLDNNAYSINFNIFVLLFFVLFKNLKTNSHIGRKLELLISKGNLDLQFQENTTATLIQRVNLDGDDDWLLANLSYPFSLNNQEYDRLLLRTEDGLLTHTFMLVPTKVEISKQKNSIVNFEKAGWLMIKM